ncbi:MAG: hypothetical protein GWN58_58530 [Anaerolineae bacterium]|nr:hypothetical protein [Anaerolineae bacterium]
MQHRLNGWGASEIYSVVSARDKIPSVSIHKAFGVSKDISGLPDLRRGSIMEAPIISLFEQRTGFRCEPWGDMIRNPTYPFLFATPDARCQEWVVEIKCVKSFANWDTPARMYQVQQQMLVSGAEQGMLVGLEMGDDYSMLRGSWNQKALLMLAEEYMMERIVIGEDDSMRRAIAKHGAAQWEVVERLRSAADRGTLYRRCEEQQKEGP